MKRVILAPAALSPAALDELKQWLGISVTAEDALLAALLRAALDLCEAFTGTMPLAASCEEVLPASAEWQGLSTRPVIAITAIEGIPAEGARYTLAPSDYEFDFAADGSGLVRVRRQGSAGRVAVRFEAGMAASWEDLPEAIRQGAIRLAAHHYRERDGAAASPPAAVAALWQPWRRLRIA
ncbi:MAG: phage head-tail connector protein [Sphingomonadales bacterium]|nr:phage head-tail connector protein [Sphingomonadales bacterium]MBD3773774.1 phage head-tail connector protein [Paracoccaceae bacterium]